MSEIPTPSVGSPVLYYPGKNPVNALPNGMEKAPAIVVQTFGSLGANLKIFLAETDPNKKDILQKWSVPHKSERGNDEVHYWDYL